MDKSIKEIMKELSLSDLGITSFQECRAVEDVKSLNQTFQKETDCSFIYLDAFVPAIVEEVCLMPQADNIKVKVVIQENTAVSVNKVLLKRVVYTLIRNAILNHHPQGDDRFVLIMVLDHAEYVLLEISDNGPGIPEVIQEKINDAFWDDTVDLDSSCLGMGLLHMKQFVKNASASIELVSEEDTGSTYRILIPKD